MFKNHVSSIELFASYSSNLFILCDVEKQIHQLPNLYHILATWYLIRIHRSSNILISYISY
jgi:hypothetical protein